MAQQRPDRVRGPAHDAFWAWCAQDQLRLQRCDSCGRISWPPVAACEHCGATSLSWARMSGRGKIVSWCTFERDYYSGLFPLPWDTILVELIEGPLFISNPKEFTWTDIQVGMPVQLDFVDCTDSAGPFRLPVFAKA